MLAQGREPAREKRAHRAAAATERGGDRVVLEVVHVPQRERSALARRQPGEQLRGPERALVAHMLVCGRGALSLPPPPAPLRFSQRGPDRGAVQPRVERARISERVASPQSDERHFLRDVCRRFPVAEDADPDPQPHA